MTGQLNSLSAFEDYFASFGKLLSDHDRGVRLQNAGLFTGNFAQGVTEEIFVVKINGGDDGDRGRENICGVETAAEAHFENCEIHSLLREIFHGHGRDALEISGVSAEFAIGEQLARWCRGFA